MTFLGKIVNRILQFDTTSIETDKKPKDSTKKSAGETPAKGLLINNSANLLKMMN